jgi:hypothetical protein
MRITAELLPFGRYPETGDEMKKLNARQRRFKKRNPEGRATAAELAKTKEKLKVTATPAEIAKFLLTNEAK